MSGKVLKNSDGYLIVYYQGKYRLVHRLIWEEFHGPIPPGYDIHHKNKYRLDNRLENLAIVAHHAHPALEHDKPLNQTDIEQMEDVRDFHRTFRERHGLPSTDGGWLDHVASRQRDAIRTLYLTHGYGLLDIGVMLGLSRERVRQIVRGDGYGDGRRSSVRRQWSDTQNRFVAHTSP